MEDIDKLVEEIEKRLDYDKDSIVELIEKLEDLIYNWQYKGGFKNEKQCKVFE